MNTPKNDELDKEGWEATFIPTFRKSSGQDDSRILIPLLKLLSIPLGVYLALLVVQDVWFAFIVGAVVLLLTRRSIIVLQIKESSNPSRAVLENAGAKLVAYAIVFFLVLMPLAVFLQKTYDLPLLPSNTYNTILNDN